MKQAFTSLAMASALAMSGAAHAETMTDTLVVGGSISAFGYTVSGLEGGGKLTFSRSLLTALNAGGVAITGIDPATVSVTRSSLGKLTAVSAGAPVYSLTGTFDNDTQILTISGLSTRGGATLTAEADDLTNTGGFLTITNIGVDLPTRTILADIIGGNGVGEVKGLAMWNFANLTGDTSFAARVGVVSSDNAVTGLTITAPAKSLFIKSLGLLEAGEVAMNRITDYGSMSSSISGVVSVPEPSTYAMAAIGVLVVAAARRKRSA